MRRACLRREPPLVDAICRCDQMSTASMHTYTTLLLACVRVHVHRQRRTVRTTKSLKLIRSKHARIAVSYPMDLSTCSLTAALAGRRRGGLDCCCSQAETAGTHTCVTIGVRVYTGGLHSYHARSTLVCTRFHCGNVVL